MSTPIPQYKRFALWYSEGPGTSRYVCLDADTREECEAFIAERSNFRAVFEIEDKGDFLSVRQGFGADGTQTPKPRRALSILGGFKMIERIERYRFDGQEFRDLAAVGNHVENEIGKIIDSTPNRMAARDALAIYEALIKNRDRLVLLLTAKYEVDPDEMQSEVRSIFDRP